LFKQLRGAVEPQALGFIDSRPASKDSRVRAALVEKLPDLLGRGRGECRKEADAEGLSVGPSG
jgi:hypothetical protein